eukprot:COSAG02_NODE_25003_length_671_cov_1.076923_2_plen_52_part_01
MRPVLQTVSPLLSAELCRAHLARIRLTCASLTVPTDNDGQTLSEKDTLIVAI